MSTPKYDYRWVMLALIWLIYAALGMLMAALAVLVTPVKEDLNMSNSQMGLVLGSFQLFFIGFSILAGNLLDRLGVRRSLMAGLLIVTLSGCLRYFANGFGTLFPIVALLGIGGPLISVGGPKVISQWFTAKERGTATGIYATGISVGMLIGLSLTNSALMPWFNNSWRFTFLFYGIVVFIVGLLWWFFARDPRQTSTSGAKMGLFNTMAHIIRIPNVQAVLIIGFLATAVFHGYFQWLPKILQNGGMSPSSAGFAASVYIVSGIPATFFFSHFIPRLFRGRAIAISSPIFALSLCGLIGTTGFLQYVSLIMLGLAGAVFLPALLLILMDSSGIPSEYLGSANGVFICIAQIGGFLAPYMMGALLDSTGSFAVGILILAGLNLVVLPIALFLKTQSQDQFVSKIRAVAEKL